MYRQSDWFHDHLWGLFRKFSSLVDSRGGTIRAIRTMCGGFLSSWATSGMRFRTLPLRRVCGRPCILRAWKICGFFETFRRMHLKCRHLAKRQNLNLDPPKRQSPENGQNLFSKINAPRAIIAYGSSRTALLLVF